MRSPAGTAASATDVPTKIEMRHAHSMPFQALKRPVHDFSGILQRMGSVLALIARLASPVRHRPMMGVALVEH
jgi:hypothetical protein